MEIKIVHCADFHLGSPVNTIKECADIRYDELLRSFSEVVKLCLAENVQALFIAGDLFDAPDAPNEVCGAVQRELSRLSIPVFIAPGNHDYYKADGAYGKLGLNDNVHVFCGGAECVQIDSLKLRVYGAGFTGRFCENPLVPCTEACDDDFINIIILHGDVVSGSGSSKYNPVNIQVLSSFKADYCALGHIHKRTQIQRLGQMSYAYCGCPEGKGFDETGEKGVYIGTVKKGECNMEFRRICKRVYHDIFTDISQCESVDEVYTQILNSLKGDCKNDLYKVTLTGHAPAWLNINTAVLENRLADDVFYAKIKDEAKVKIDFDSLLNEYSLRGFFIKEMLLRLEHCKNAGDRDGEEKCIRAIEYGLRAFEGEVSVREDS